MASNADIILAQRRQENKRALETRIARVYESIPRIKDIDKEIRETNLLRIRSLFNGGDTDAFTKRIEDLNAEKDRLLKAKGVPAKYMEMHYHCYFCKDTGVYQGRPCSCKKALIARDLYSQSEIEGRIRSENFDNFNANLFRKSRMEDELESPYENIIAIKENLQQYVENFRPGFKSLYFYGKVGTGKTFMLNCLAKALMDKGYSLLYQSSIELLDFLTTYQFMYAESKLQNKDKHDLIFSVDILIIDDLGTEPKNDRAQANLFEVINRRIVAGKTTFISSNIPPHDLGAAYDARISSRIMGEYELYEFYGNDLRAR